MFTAVVHSMSSVMSLNEQLMRADLLSVTSVSSGLIRLLENSSCLSISIRLYHLHFCCQLIMGLVFFLELSV